MKIGYKGTLELKTFHQFFEMEREKEERTKEKEKNEDSAFL